MIHITTDSRRLEYLNATITTIVIFCIFNRALTRTQRRDNNDRLVFGFRQCYVHTVAHHN